MACGFPIEIKGQMVPCGKCQGCRRKNRRAWVGRMLLEQRDHEECSFVTLTYNDDNLPYVHDEETDQWIPTLVNSHPRKWLRSLRDSGLTLRYFGSGEYGEKTLRPHYHLIIFGLGPGAIDHYQKAWTKGFVSAYEANARTMSYVAKYCLKGSRDPEPQRKLIYKPRGKDGTHPEEERSTLAPFRIMSLRPPIGASYGKNIATALSTLKGKYVLEEPHVYPRRVLRIGKDSYPTDRTIRNHVMDGLGLPRAFQSQVFHYEQPEYDEEKVKSAQVNHRQALRKRHSRTKL